MSLSPNLENKAASKKSISWQEEEKGVDTKGVTEVIETPEGR